MGETILLALGIAFLAFGLSKISYPVFKQYVSERVYRYIVMFLLGIVYIWLRIYMQ